MLSKEFLTIVDYPGYFINKEGKVWSEYSKAFKKQRVHKSGYVDVQLYQNGKHTTPKIHKLITTTFFGKIPPGLVVNHIDGNKLNNHMSNLEYVTQSYNSIDAFNRGTRNNSGLNSPRTKLNIEQIKSIKKMINTYTTKEISHTLNVSRAIINHIKYDDTWRNVKC